MKIDHRVLLLGGILTTFLMTLGVGGRALTDFNNDRDLNAWHEFGLRSFYGPWSLVVRRPNGDLITYDDYGSTIPSGFLPISTTAESESESSSSKNFDPSSDPPQDTVQNDHDYEMRYDDTDKNIKKLDTLELIGIVGIIEGTTTVNDEETTSQDAG